MRVSGLDLHKDTVFGSIIEDGCQKDNQVFETHTIGLHELKAWLVSHDVKRVGMESTGMYWQAVEKILSEQMETLVVNAYYVKQVPGKKSDQKDAEWIGQLLSRDLLPSSYIARGVQSDLRTLSRYRTSLKRKRTEVLVQMSNLLDRSNIRLRRLFSSLSAKSCQKVIEALIKGDESAEQLVNYVHKRTINRHTKDFAIALLQGTMNAHDRFVLGQLKIQFDVFDEQISQLEKRLQALAQDYAPQALAILQSIPGIGKISAIHVLAEVGKDMSYFKSPKHLASWVGLSPRNDESAGKMKSRRIKPGNVHLRPILVQCALAAIRAKNSHFTTVYANLCKRMNNKKAVIAVAHKMIVLIHILISRNETYRLK